jgi:hypothetical protein
VNIHTDLPELLAVCHGAASFLWEIELSICDHNAAKERSQRPMATLFLHSMWSRSTACLAIAGSNCHCEKLPRACMGKAGVSTMVEPKKD